ncbi:MAG: dihydroorotase family protein [Candidatus Thorarchaeota archaeon]|nr:MAG: dihydroorotase family protein [Candidatus Thorarchaeota archaeon]
MTIDLLLANGFVILEGREVVRSVGIDAGRIEGIYESGAKPKSAESIDCAQKYILPGTIDTHVHLRDLNLEYKEDFLTGTMAAAAGGVTTVVDMPNSDPPTLTRSTLDKKISEAEEKRYVNIGFFAGIQWGKQGFDVSLSHDILGVKVYPHSPLKEEVSYTPSRIRECMKISVEHDLPILIHPDSSDAKKKPADADEFFQQHSCESEVESLRRFLLGQSVVGGRLHVCHVSCATTVRTIEENRAEMSLTAEVCPHHMFLSSGEFTHNDGRAKALPPLRSPYDASILRNALKMCTIDIVVSDHAPHTVEEKKLPFMEAPSGIAGLETTVPILLTEVFEGRMSWVEYLRCCCSGPARVFGIANKGVLSKGFDADITVVSREEYSLSSNSFLSKAKMTPFEGRRVQAKPVLTIVGGEVVYDNGKIVMARGTAGRVPVRKT